MRKTLLRRPTETTKTAKAVFLGVFRGGKSRLLPAFTVPASFGQKRPILPKGRAGPCGGGPEGRRRRFLDGKRGFLTTFGGILSVLFGGRIRLLESRIRACSGTPFGQVLAKSALFHPLIRPKPARTGQKTSQKVANMQPFWCFPARKTCFLVTFVTGKWIQAAPLITLRKECYGSFRHL